MLKRYWYPVWWVISWQKHCSVGRKVSAIPLLLLFLIPVVGVVGTVIVLLLRSASIIETQRSDPIGGESFLILLWGTIQFTWPFLLVIAPPKVHRDGIRCCSGCGQVDDTLRVVSYTVGFALFGLIPLYGAYKRTFCSLCRGLTYRIVIICQNLFAIITFPVGTVMGLIWLVRNNTSKTIIEEEHISHEATPLLATKLKARDPNDVICGNCGFEQWSGYTQCQKCGMTFS